jgi:hypothetical protein
MRSTALAVVSACALLAGCEPLLESQTTATEQESTRPPAVTASTTSTAPTPTIQQHEPSRGNERALSPEQLAAMTRARMSVSDSEIMRQLADRAERIARNLATSAPAPVPARVQAGSNRGLGYHLMIEFGWPATEWPALDALWARESGWNQYAENRSSGAYGIPQSLPAGKMAAVGPDWKTNPETQIRWGLAYIGARYGSPKAAWAHSEKFGWY